MDKTDLNREKYRIVYTYYAKPIAELAEEYKLGALTQCHKVVDKKVSKCFDDLVEALNEQLNELRK